MPDVKLFNIDGTDISVKDETARTMATNAESTANDAMALAEEIAELSRLEISYNSSTETITFTRSGGN